MSLPRAAQGNNSRIDRRSDPLTEKKVIAHTIRNHTIHVAGPTNLNTARRARRAARRASHARRAFLSIGAHPLLPPAPILGPIGLN